jgi:hypothetical protein
MRQILGLLCVAMLWAPAHAEVLQGHAEVQAEVVKAQLQKLKPRWDAAGLSEHCSCLDPNRVQVINSDGQWLLADNGTTVAGFGQQKDAADAALRVVKYYGFTQACSAGRSGGSDLHEMRYFKTPIGAPQGTMSEEDAISIDPATVKAEQLQGTWKVTSGDKWLLDYGSDPEAAEQAASIIRIYQFTQQCFVGNPQRLMMYFRK